MSHLPHHWIYIATAYGLTFCCSIILSTQATSRLKRAKKRLKTVEKCLPNRERSSS